MNDYRGDRQTGEPTNTSRRQLLRAASGGVALAASGLFLPQWLEEAAARPGASGGELGGRRGKDHKGRDKHRNHGDRKRSRSRSNKNGSSPGDAHYRWIWFYVYNDRPVTTPNGSVSVQGWANKGGIADHYEKVPLVSVANGTYHAFDFRGNEAASVIIDDGYWVDADNSNVLPFAPVVLSMGFDGTMTKFGYSGGTVVEDTTILAENEQIKDNMNGRIFTVKRLYDTDDYKFFDIRFT